MKVCLFFLCFLITIYHVYAAMTEKQLNATKKLVRNTCQNKAKVTSEQIDAMHNGDYSDAQAHLTKDIVFDWEGGIKALVANAPPSIAEPGAVSIKNCKDAIKTPTDKCVASMEIARCLYNDNPSNYFFP